MAKTIQLNNGKFAIVDDYDYEFLSRFNWTGVKKGVHEKVLEFACTTKKGEDRKTFRIYMHEFIVGNKHIDITKSNLNVIHINGNSLDNRKENLKLVPFHTVSHRARKKTLTRSKYKGIYFHRQSGLWSADIQKDKKQYHIGYYKKEEDAALAYNAKARELYGDLAYQNKVV